MGWEGEGCRCPPPAAALPDLWKGVCFSKPSCPGLPATAVTPLCAWGGRTPPPSPGKSREGAGGIAPSCGRRGKTRAPGSSPPCPPSGGCGHKWKCNLSTRRCFFTGRVVQVWSRSGWGRVSILGDIRNAPGCGPGQPAPAGPARAEGRGQPQPFWGSVIWGAETPQTPPSSHKDGKLGARAISMGTTRFQSKQGLKGQRMAACEPLQSHGPSSTAEICFASGRRKG